MEPVIATRTCGECARWHKQKATGGQPTPDNGDCRRYPPHATPILSPPRFAGNMPQLTAVISIYPSMPPTYPACDEFKARLTLE